MKNKQEILELIENMNKEDLKNFVDNQKEILDIATNKLLKDNTDFDIWYKYAEKEDTDYVSWSGIRELIEEYDFDRYKYIDIDYVIDLLTDQGCFDDDAKHILMSENFGSTKWDW